MSLYFKGLAVVTIVVGKSGGRSRAGDSKESLKIINHSIAEDEVQGCKRSMIM